VTTFAGLPGEQGGTDGISDEARFNNPWGNMGLAVDPAGNLIVADASNHTIRRIDRAGTVRTIAGLTRAQGSVDGPGPQARLNYPTGVAVDRHGNIFVADTGNGTIRKLSVEGVMTTIAGEAGMRGSVDGVGSAARFTAPGGIVVDADGTLYVASHDDTIRRVSAEGVVTTIAGRAGAPGRSDGRGDQARFWFSLNMPVDLEPIGLAFDLDGSLLATDVGNRRLRRITREGVVTTFAESFDFSWPTGIAVHPSGDVYVSDSGLNGVILRSIPEAPPLITVAPSQIVASGATVVLSAPAGPARGVAFQWRRNGLLLPDETRSTLVIPSVRELDAGFYEAEVTNSAGFSLSAGTRLTVAGERDAGRVLNFSVRSSVRADSPTLILGATIAGSTANTSMPALFPAVGPSLDRFGVSDYVRDPELSVRFDDVIVGTNDNWNGDTQAALSGAQVGAFELLSPASLDAAIATALTPHVYTVHLGSKGSAPGVVLGEIFDATPPAMRGLGSPQLRNLSARSYVGTAADTLVLGFSIGGQTAATVLLRAAGPSLRAHGVSDVLDDPVIHLFSGSTLIRENNDWGGDAHVANVARAVGAFEFSDPTSRDAALLVTLPPGIYTLQVRSANNETGVAVVEVYVP
jgi:sugar lactone lactonase YvrE